MGWDVINREGRIREGTQNLYLFLRRFVRQRRTSSGTCVCVWSRDVAEHVTKRRSAWTEMGSLHLTYDLWPYFGSPPQRLLNCLDKLRKSRPRFFFMDWSAKRYRPVWLEFPASESIQGEVQCEQPLRTVPELGYATYAAYTLPVIRYSLCYAITYRTQHHRVTWSANARILNSYSMPVVGRGVLFIG